VYAHTKGIKFIIVPPDGLNNLFDFEDAFHAAAEQYREAFGRECYIAASRRYGEDDAKQLFRIQELADRLDMAMIATNDVHYHHPDRRQLQDIVTCTREHCTISEAGYRLHANAERHLKDTAEMIRLFRPYPDAIRRTQEIVEACTFSLSSLKYIYPKEIATEGRTPHQQLAHLVNEGLKERFGTDIPQKVRDQLDYELAFIERKNYSEYFLTVEDICRFARQQGILNQGRGSAANCACCYYLGITNVDPTKFDLLFERFLSDARDEPPDIDVDFEHERREEVMQYIYEKYGRDRAAIVATVYQLRQKGAVRDVAKAMGLSEDAIDRLSKSVWEFSPEWFEGHRLSEQGFDPKDPQLQKILELTAQYMGFPRQLGQHTGGFVITDGQLSDLCPIFNARMEARTNIEWDKNDIDALGFLKIDVLALGMLTAIRKMFDLAKEYYGLDLTLHNIPLDDPKVYEMISAADTIGVFQIESRAQQAMLPRMKPKEYYDLVIEVALVRPGPIQGGMVHPYLDRRNGLEPITYPSKALEKILARTLGVPLFQEQVMSIGMEAAGLTAAEADQLRRSMATFKGQGIPRAVRDRLVAGMLKNGYTREYAEKLVGQIAGFGSYGFPESHSISFALPVYISSWNKCYYPDIFLVSILNSQPMGFYAPAELIDDAKAHGVNVYPIDINASEWDSTLGAKQGKYYSVRLGFRLIHGIREEEMLLLIAGRLKPYTSIGALLDAGLTLTTLEKLADADAFQSLGLDRRQALWQVAALGKPITHHTKEGIVRQMDLFRDAPENVLDAAAVLPTMQPSEHVVQDFATTGLSLRAHPVSFLRPKLRQLGNLTATELRTARSGQRVNTAGLILVRQRPGTAKGVCFITLKDETGTINLIVWPDLFDQFRHQILNSKLLMVKGHLQIKHGVTHVIVQSAYNLNPLLAHLTPDQQADIPVLSLSRADEKDGTPFSDVTGKPDHPNKGAAAMPDGRNFK
jgi:error-prone DNA polymerase